MRGFEKLLREMIHIHGLILIGLTRQTTVTGAPATTRRADWNFWWYMHDYAGSVRAIKRCGIKRD